MRHEEAVAAIQKLGGRFQSPQLGGGSTAPHLTGLVVLDNQWRGGDAGLTHLGDLLGLQLVVIVGTDISLAGLTELQNVEQLRELRLYGTNLEHADLEKVRSLLPQASLDYRRGGLLGVAGNAFDGAGPAIVNSVQKGSAAEAAGMMPGDEIEQFNGQPVGTFKELTEKIGQLRAGEEIKLDVLRAGQRVSFTLKLGQWQTI
jgi:membrane-associated protease RseP (regulator of RpoE activity)